MKKCPACDKTFEDSMRFCQVDGTPLVDDAPPLDPYATMVGHKFDLTPSEPVAAPAEEIIVEPLVHETSGSVPIAEPDEVLDLPGADPLKTMYVSASELKEVFGAGGQSAGSTEDDQILDVGSEPDPPSFSIPETPSPPPSPFSASDAEAETVLSPSASPPFKVSEPAPVAEWTPPTTPDTAWQNQQIGANAPFQPVSLGVAEQSKGLAISSLVCGILSCLCCFSVVTGPAAVVMGFIAKKKADENPSEFGGSGMALGGMITGALGFVLGIVLIILQVFFGVLGGLLGNMPR